MILHLYTVAHQPATAYVVQYIGGEVHTGFRPGQWIWCLCCGKKRRAKNCVVQCYYDGMNIWCAPGYGCKHPQEIARKRRKEHMNRSRAQLARREMEKIK